MLKPVRPPYQFFTDASGKALDAGFIFIGQPGLEARSSPKASWFDAAGSIPSGTAIGAAVRTMAGYPVNPSGAAATFFVDGDFSITVLDRHMELVWSATTSPWVEETFADVPRFSTAPDLRADNSVLNDYPVGTFVQTQSEGFAYTIVAPGSPTFHLLTAGGVKLNFVALGREAIPLAAFGWADNATPAENTLAWTNARDLGISLGVRNFFFPPNATDGVYAECNGLALPTFIADDTTQTPGRSMHLYGIDELSTRIRLHSGATSALSLIGHASANTLVNRAQNSFVRISRMELRGRSALGSDQPCIQLDNTWAFHLHDLIVGGNIAGYSVDVHSYSRGGAQTGTIERVRHWKSQQWVDGTNPTQYSLATLRARGDRYMIGLRGAVDGIGKANNIRVIGCEGYYSAFGLVDTLPFAAGGSPDYTSVIFPNGGGNDWINLENCFLGAEGWQKIETGLILTVTSQTQLGLQTAPVTNTGVDVYKDMVIRALNPADGYWYSRRVNAMSAGRVVTVVAFPFTVTTSTEYEIAYADVKFWTTGGLPGLEGGHAGIRPHIIRHSTRAYRTHLRNCRMEEGVLAVKMSYASSNISFVDCDTWSNRSEGFMVFDSGAVERPLYWAPDVILAQQPMGERAANAHLWAKSIMLTDPEDFSTDTVIMTRKINKIAAGLPSGRWARLGTNMEDLELPVNDANVGWTPHVYVWNPQEQTAWLNEAAGVVLRGWGSVNVHLTAAQAVVIGDCIVSALDANSSNLGAIVVAASGRTVSNLHKVMGRITKDVTATTAGVYVVQASIGVMGQ